MHKAYQILRHVSRVVDLCCNYRCRQAGALRQTAFALQKSGNRVVLRVPDGIICCMNEKQCEGLQLYYFNFGVKNVQ